MKTVNHSPAPTSQRSYSLFFSSAKDDESKRIVYDEAAVRELLDRSKKGIEEKQTLANEYLSSFKVASYVVKSKDEVRERERVASLL